MGSFLKEIGFSLNGELRGDFGLSFKEGKKIASDILFCMDERKA